MALNVPNVSAQPAATNTAPNVNTQAPRQVRSFASDAGMPQFGLVNHLAGTGSGGDAYEKIFARIQAQIKKSEENKVDEKYAVVKLLKGPSGLNYSGIVVAETRNEVTAAHILMIEKTGMYPEKLIENYGGVRYEITRTPAAALDEKYVYQAQLAVGNHLKIDPASVIIVDGTLVPSEFDVESEVAIDDLLNNTFNATHVEIATRVYDYKGTDLSQLIQQNRNGKFYVGLYFSNDETSYFDQTGMPIRQDVCIALSYKLNNQTNNKSVNQGDDSVEIVKTYGYIDFEFTGPAVVNNMMTSQKFVPNFIITHIESRVAPTPDIAMLGVASVMALNEDMNWMQAFRPTVARKNEIDLKDIGALNVEGNIEQSPTGFGKKYDTKSKTATVIELNKLIQTLVRPNLMISVDLPQAGPETWYLSAFQYIKFRNSREAYDRVNGYMNNATGGAFQANNLPMFSDVSNKMHGGFYRTKEGFRDLRHLTDYLAVANFVSETNQAPVMISQYTNTLYNSTMPSELRASTRRTYVDEMSNKTAVVKQMYDRVTFNGAYVANWVMALRNIGFAPIFTNMGNVNDMFVKRATADFNSAMLGQDVRLMGASNNLYGGHVPFGYYNRTF